VCRAVFQAEQDIRAAKRGPVLCYSVDGGKFQAVKGKWSSDKFAAWNEAAKRGEVFAG
jgi:hypothetical protein